jgi:alkylation response protein AidB-like acyl-CoA dehydrogenase
MHNATMLWAGEVSDMLDFTAEEAALHERRRAELFRGVVENGIIHSQPFSEGISAGATSGVATKAELVDGGFRVTGRKIFASLSGAAHRYNITCQVPGEPFIRLLSVPADADGVEIVGDWDPLGMRGTVSRTLLFHDVFVHEDNEVMPPRGYDQAAQRFPFLFMSLAPSYLGLTRGVLDFVRGYLRGDIAGSPGGPPRRDLPQKQAGWAHLQIAYERSRSLLYDVLDNTVIDPDEELLARAWAAVYTTMETANEVAALAVRVCGGQSMLKHLPLERMYRDSRLGSTMLPWSAEVCLDRLGRARLYDE